MDLKGIFKNKHLVGLILIIVVVVLFVWFMGSGSSEGLDVTPSNAVSFSPNDESPQDASAVLVKPVGSELTSNCAPAPTYLDANGQITPSDLLPSSTVATDFSNEFPCGAADLTGKNFLVAGYNMGINTVSNSNKNPNLQLRSDPYIPPVQVGPWNQSSILPDLNRKTFEIGSNC